MEPGDRVLISFARGDGALILPESLARDGQHPAAADAKPSRVPDFVRSARLTDGHSTDNYPATFDGVTISLSNSAGSVPCEVYYVSPTQVNFYVPASAPLGPNTITVQSGGTTTYSATVYIREVNPGLFTAKEDGTGWALGQAYWTDASTGKAQITALSSGSGASAQYVAIPMSQATGNVTLALYGTGLRGRSDQQNVFMLFDGELGTIQYASSQPTYLGLDQVNVQVPSDLKGRGDVQAILIVDGVAAPAVDLYFQ